MIDATIGLQFENGNQDSGEEFNAGEGGSMISFNSNTDDSNSSTLWFYQSSDQSSGLVDPRLSASKEKPVDSSASGLADYSRSNQEEIDPDEE